MKMTKSLLPLGTKVVDTFFSNRAVYKIHTGVFRQDRETEYKDKDIDDTHRDRRGSRKKDRRAQRQAGNYTDRH